MGCLDAWAVEGVACGDDAPSADTLHSSGHEVGGVAKGRFFTCPPPMAAGRHAAPYPVAGDA